MIEQDLQLNEIQREVRDRYAEAANAATSSAMVVEAATKSDAFVSCCGDGCCSTEASGTYGIELYDAAERQGLPDAALLASLGCGNPVAVAELR